MEQSIGVFGQEVLCWVCVLQQTPHRPPAETIYQHANHLLDEAARSEPARHLPMQSADDAQFALAALIDEVAMALPDLRPLWSRGMLQATRHNTNNAGVELFERLARVRQGPASVLATYAAVLGLGFQGCYGLPGADRYALAQLRRDLAVQLGVDPDRDWRGGVIRPVHKDQVDNLELFRVPWFKTVGFGRALGVFAIASAVAAGYLTFG
ncbi:MAG: DotU family type IV/VI secretion system protein [Myxococcota bacterium]